MSTPEKPVARTFDADRGEHDTPGEDQAKATSGDAAGIRSAVARYRFFAYATGVFLLLLTAHMVVKYVLHHEGGLGSWIPMVHGWLYLAYVLVTIDLWLRTRLAVLPTVGVVLAGTIPFMSFVAERWVRTQVQAQLRD